MTRRAYIIRSCPGGVDACISLVTTVAARRCGGARARATVKAGRTEGVGMCEPVIETEHSGQARRTVGRVRKSSSIVVSARQARMFGRIFRAHRAEISRRTPAWLLMPFRAVVTCGTCLTCDLAGDVLISSRGARDGCRVVAIAVVAGRTFI